MFPSRKALICPYCVMKASDHPAISIARRRMAFGFRLQSRWPVAVQTVFQSIKPSLSAQNFAVDFPA